MRTAGMNVTLVEYFFIGRGANCKVTLGPEILAAQFFFHGPSSFTIRIIIEI
jgi:hypothetical protein